MTRRGGKRPDGVTQIPWQAGKLIAWDVTVVSTLADSYASVAVRGAGEVAELAATKKCEMYADISGAYTFLPIAIETQCNERGGVRLLSSPWPSNQRRYTGDDREVAFTFQRLSVLIQRFSSSLFSETFALHYDPDL